MTSRREDNVMAVVIEDQEEQPSSGLSFLGLLVVGGALAACFLNQPTGQPAPTVNQQYVSIARQDAIAAGINPNLFVNQITQESHWNPNAISPTGAIGIAQFEPSTAASMGIDPYSPEQSLQGAAQLMAGYEQQYGDEEKALAAYNAGPGTVDEAVSNCGAAWKSCLPSETQAYISVVEQ
jgi:soluble lytic murein transglycosylase-like protein